ncbi:MULTISPECIES: ATP-dependent RNA helicase DbpA [Pantoea]|uniref:ATP-dependent RNA helicase DbpA n=2 Tax=Pantoea TaxID=53335 RepID=A0ABY2ZB03_9GAMM|nr:MULTISPECIES: ATP-dependent RNA helicase DbpA [Pantoea]KAF6662041.1 ATP-dependent RNA helicase DbpA [Enterobacteriaceae bacterium EKM102V]KAA5973359.1 ATP-dependent RNA helicase DbpA [Pantoea sp. M_6]KAA5980968.1 ATP-dependent RNA helicase DbpA [Pantoea sp. M_8]KAA5994649.1 ATP-dependent RNA helicase DbpA [Pantoea sp. M_10]KAF6664378.1 ATP-dependent RNA helicase DbpA [Pantoea sp. EKM101V]
MTAFSTLNSLPDSQLDNLREMGYTSMTPVQAATLPAILQGRDVRAQAKTGSGKTAAFGIGLLHHIDSTRFQTQALILCPTRELADQVGNVLRQLARFTRNIKVLTLCGGQPMSAQRDSLVHPPHIVVGTPGRILDHIHRENLKLDQLNTLVLDEADRMLEMGFLNDMETIIEATPASRQTLLFSATWPDGITAISTRFQRDALSVVTEDVSELPAIDQQFFEASHNEKLGLLIALLSDHQPASCVVFCNTKRECDDVAAALNARDISALPLHGDLEQRDRERVLIRFANGSGRVLVATDVAARGLDIKSLAMVVNYQLAWDPEVHLHRIGRTARAGEHGVAVSLVAPDEMARAHALEDFLQQKLPWIAASTLKKGSSKPLPAAMMTLCIDGGRKAKIRPGDILGALTGEAGYRAEQIGKIVLTPTHAYVAIEASQAKGALVKLKQGKIKGKTCRAILLKD